MTQFDIIIVSNASTRENYSVTERCINSILETVEDGYRFNIIVVEQNNIAEYENAQTLHYDFEFNYNKCLNYGLKHSSARFKGVCNNDLIFHHKWFLGIESALNNGFGSVSPYCPAYHPKFFEMANVCISGYKSGIELAGWAIFMTDETMMKIGELNDSVTFWYSDDIYSEQLRYHKIKHGLVCNSFVTHIGSHTLKQTNSAKYNSMTVGQRKAFGKERNKIWKGEVVDVYEHKKDIDRTIERKAVVKKETEKKTKKKPRKTVQQKIAEKQAKEYSEVTVDEISIVKINKKNDGEKKEGYVQLRRIVQTGQT